MLRHESLHNFYVMTSRVTKAVRAAIERAPCSVNKLAEAAGVPQSTLARIKAGELGATPRVARSVAKALQRWGDDCHQAAARVRQATAKEA